jgi:membrane peptidoglycan carboxypeptidase
MIGKKRRQKPYALAQVALTFFVTMTIATLGVFALRFGETAVSFLVSGDIVQMFTMQRNVFSFLHHEIQNPVANIWALIFFPMIEFAALLAVLVALRKLFCRINRVYRKVYFKESDSIYFGLIATSWFIVVDVFMFSQNLGRLFGFGDVQTLFGNYSTLLMHHTLLALSKLSFVIYYFTANHINMLGYERYRHSLTDGTVVMSPFFREIIMRKKLTIAFAYVLGVLLTVPFHFGIHWSSNPLAFFLFLAFCVLVWGKGLRPYINHLLDYLKTIQFNISFDRPAMNNLSFRLTNRTRYLLVGICLILGLIFVVLRIEFFMMGLLLLGMATILSYVAFIVIYFGTFLLSNCRLYMLYKKMIFPKSQHWRAVFVVYPCEIIKAVFRATLPVKAVILLIFAMITIFPKPLLQDYNGKMALNRSVVDDGGEVLSVDSLDTYHSVPITYDMIPRFFKIALFLFEDQLFESQRSAWFQPSNWNGFSRSAFFSTRGGSNINMQLIRNLAFNRRGAGVCFSRKISEMFSAIVLSANYSTEDILTYYVNNVPFHGYGGGGHVGLQAAALHAFGRPISRLNNIELMYLARTLTRHPDLHGTPKNAEKRRDNLLIRAESWARDGSISEEQLRILRNDTLRFVNRTYRPAIASGSRLLFENYLASLPNAKYVSSITRRNQDRLQTAFQQYLQNRNFPVPQHNDYKLYGVIFAIDYRTGEVIGHYTNHPTNPMTNFGAGFSVASLIKPFILAEMLENNLPIRLWDGERNGRRTPQNPNRTFLNDYAEANIILSRSLNAPFINLRDVTNPTILFQKMENRFQEMGIIPQMEATQCAWNYPLGSNRNMTLWDIAQAHQTLFNGGIHIPLAIVDGAWSFATNSVKPLPKTETQVYSKQTVTTIKNALTNTIHDGTATSVRNILPANRRFYVKTATTQGANMGFTVLADDQILILTWLSYGKEKNGRLELNRTPPIPHRSAGNSAALLAAFAYAQLSQR